MALHKDFPESPYAILDPASRWFPADESLRETGSEKLMPPLVSELRKKVEQFRDSGYAGATDTSKSLLNWWFNTPHLLPQAYLPSPSGRGAGGEGLAEFQYYFAQREALETVVYLYDVVGVQDKGDAEIRDTIKLRQTRPFVTKDRNYLIPKKSVFNRIIGDSHFELVLASFPEDCSDVVSYAKNYLAVHFKLDYVNADGDIKKQL